MGGGKESVCAVQKWGAGHNAHVPGELQIQRKDSRRPRRPYQVHTIKPANQGCVYYCSFTYIIYGLPPGMGIPGYTREYTRRV